MDTLRTFIAIELPADVRVRITEHIKRLRRECPDVRASWSREDNLHLTLKFLGDVPIERIPALSTAVAQAAQDVRPFDLIVRDCGAFPPHGRPKVLWIGISSESTALAGGPALGARASGLQVLHESLENECADAGFERDARGYHPHLTIARLRTASGSRALGEAHKALDFSSQRFTVSEIIVFKSELLREGSRHTPLSRHPFVSASK